MPPTSLPRVIRRPVGAGKGPPSGPGTRVHLSGTCEEDLPHLVVAVRTTPATTFEVAVLDDVQDILAAGGVTASEHSVDEGYATGEAVDKAAHDGIELVGPLVLDHSGQAKEGLGYDRDSFDIDGDTQQATCPPGHLSRSWTRREHPGGDGAAIGFHRQGCQPCPVRAHGTKSALEGRQIVIGSRTLDDLQRKNRADRNDPDWKRRYNRRAGIEGTISQGVRGLPLRHCQDSGLTKTRVQHVLTACAMNATRIADWHERHNQHQPGRSTGSLKTLPTRRSELDKITAG